MLISIIFILAAMEACHSARILAVFPVPSISHQLVFRPYVHELARRGHEVVVITTDPVLKTGEQKNNLKELDVGAISYSVWKEYLLLNSFLSDDVVCRYRNGFKLINKVTEEQMKTDQVQNLINDKTVQYDLLIWEIASRIALSFSLYNITVIGISSLGGYIDQYHMMGANDHPIMNPKIASRRTFNLTMIETIKEVYSSFWLNKMYKDLEFSEMEVIKDIFGPNVPTLEEMKSRVEMLFLNNHPIWDINRPVPRGVLYLGNLNEKPISPLPVDLKTYLDSSINGVIYMSFGTNCNPSLLSNRTVKIFKNVFSRLPYNIVMKWSDDNLLDQPENVKVSKWLPQSDLLRHSKVKLFITQGGLQSTEEAITAGVPLIGFPLASDQHYNTQQYVYRGIGEVLDLKSLTEEHYRQNMRKLRKIMRDQQYSALEHAVLWTEYILRNGESVYLHGSSADMHWAEYFEVELVIYVIMLVVIVNSLFIYILKKIRKLMLSKVFKTIENYKTKLLLEHFVYK